MNVRETATKHLTAIDGWKATHGTALANKFYSTAVGPKDAQAYLQSWGEGRYMLTGHYRSEGQNVLDSICVLLNDTMDEQAIERGVQAFAEAVDSKVGQSYAARLLALGVTA